MQNADERFDKLEGMIEGLAVSVAKGFKSVDERFAQVDARFDAIDKRFELIDVKFAEVNDRFGEVGRRLQSMQSDIDNVKDGVGRIEQKFDAKYNFLDKRISKLEEPNGTPRVATH